MSIIKRKRITIWKPTKIETYHANKETLDINTRTKENLRLSMCKLFRQCMVIVHNRPCISVIWISLAKTFWSR
jgi:hypothetical protein